MSKLDVRHLLLALQAILASLAGFATMQGYTTAGVYLAEAGVVVGIVATVYFGFYSNGTGANASEAKVPLSVLPKTAGDIQRASRPSARGP